MTTHPELARYRPAVVVGAALAGVLWGATGVVALLDPGPDPGPYGSTSFLLIERGHALAETGWVVVLLGLWRSQRGRIGRVASVLFALAATASLLLAVVTYVVVGATALGLRLDDPSAQSPPPALVAVVSVLFLLALIGLVVGFIGSGVTTVRSGVWHPGTGWPLIVHPVLIAANLFVYPVGIAIGIAWLALAWAARRG